MTLRGPRRSPPAAGAPRGGAVRAVSQRALRINPLGRAGDWGRWLFRFLKICEYLKQTLLALS